MHFSKFVILLIAAAYPALGAPTSQHHNKHNKMITIYGAGNPHTDVVSHATVSHSRNRVPTHQQHQKIVHEEEEDEHHEEEGSVEPRDMAPWLHKLMNSRIGHYLPIPVQMG